MGVFRRSRWVTTANGRRVRKRAENYTIEYRNAAGIVRRVAGTKSKEESRAIEARLVAEVARERAGLETKSDRESLRPVAEHVVDYLAAIESRGRVARHVRQTEKMLGRILDDLGAQRLGDVTKHRVDEWVRAKRQAVSDSSTKTLSPSTLDSYRRAIKGLCRWAWREGRITADPLAGLSLTGARGDLRYKRRALTEKEIRRLLAATHASERVYRGLTGTDRHTLYLVALSSGLRAGELAALRAADLALDDDPPTVTCRASTSKNRTEAVLPIPADVADVLRERVARMLPAATVFAGTWRERAATMLRADLAEAEIEAENADGRIDFHALRATYITRLARSGVSLVDAQKLARHSTPVLTANTYTRLRLDDSARAVARLPRLIGSDDDEQASEAGS